MFRITSLQNIFCLQQDRGRRALDSENCPRCCVILCTQPSMSLVKTIHSFSGAAKSRSFRTSVRQRQLVIHFSGQCTELSHGGALPLFTRGSFQALNISADVMERKKIKGAWFCGTNCILGRPGMVEWSITVWLIFKCQRKKEKKIERTNSYVQELLCR